ncbi:MAG TPA: twin-arginine translocation signal domain-containing protein, partial [Planctomycetota bacterium]|nr:twin-arginine translocation signal domain-containing protein [Planctomycetota bacterium]
MTRTTRGCSEYGDWSRRDFLKRTSLGAGAALAAQAWFPRVLAAQPGAPSGPGSGRDVLIYIFLRGGLDGLSLLPPHGDGDYYALRPTLGVPPPGASGGALDLDGFFGLLPAAAPLLPAFAQGRLAFVHAAGTTDHTRSHFEAFKKVEFGIPSLPIGTVHDGWLARHLSLVPPLSDGPLRAAALREVLPLALTGAPRTLPIAVPAAFDFPGAADTAALRKAALASMYAAAPAPLGPAALDTLASIELLEDVDFAAPPQHGAAYPDTPFGASLRACAALVRQGVPV